MAKNKIEPTKVIEDIQNDEARIILNNPISNPKFLRKISKTESVVVNDLYTQKLFYEIVSLLKPEHLEGLRKYEHVALSLNIRDFIQGIDGNLKHYTFVIDSAKMLRTIEVNWNEGDVEITTGLVSDIEHHPGSGQIEVQMNSKLVKQILEVKEKGNFSFYKAIVFKLQGISSIKFYTFFKSWANYESPLEIGFENFKQMFGYDTNGYRKFSAFQAKVLDPAINEINEKTDIRITWSPIGTNLEGIRPRISGLRFMVKKKEVAPPILGLVASSESDEMAQDMILPTEEEVHALAQSVGIKAIQVEVLVEEFENDLVQVWENLKGLEQEQLRRQDGQQKIASPIGYILKSVGLGKGLWAEELNQREAKKSNKPPKPSLKDLQRDYDKRIGEFLIGQFEKASARTRNAMTKKLLAEAEERGMNTFWFTATNELKPAGKKRIGWLLAEKGTLPQADRQLYFIEETKSKYDISIKFNDKDELIRG